MQLQTYSAIKTKLQNDLDIEDLDFINGEEELVGYINEAIDDAESIVHTLGLDATYFLTNTTITLVSGTTDYTLPSDIFANKIKKMFYINGTKKYEVFRIKDLREIPFVQAGADYKYILINTSTPPNGMRIRFLPSPAEAGTYIHVYYIRNALSMTTDDDDTDNVCEIPESVNFIYQHVKTRVYEKMGSPLLQLAVQELASQKQLMVDTLQDMVPDENNIIQPDTSFYDDSYQYFNGSGQGN